MLSDEEIVLKRLKETLDVLKGKNVIGCLDFQIRDMVEDCIRVIEKQSKETEELENNNKLQPDCEEPIERTEEMVNMRWVNHNYISKEEYKNAIETTFKVCNKHWKDKIKARIKELEEYLYKGNIKDDFLMIRIKAKIQELLLLLEKE